MAWRKENKVDLYPAATKDNKLPLLYPVRGFDTIPDGNLTSDPGVSESVLRIYRWMGGSCLHKTDKDGCPIYIERLVWHGHVDKAIGYKIIECLFRDIMQQKNWQSTLRLKKYHSIMWDAMNFYIVSLCVIALSRPTRPLTGKQSFSIAQTWIGAVRLKISLMNKDLIGSFYPYRIPYASSLLYQGHLRYGSKVLSRNTEQVVPGQCSFSICDGVEDCQGLVGSWCKWKETGMLIV